MTVADALAIACKDEECSAWRADQEQPVWTATLPGSRGATGPASFVSTRQGYLPVVTHDSTRYTILGTEVIELDTGTPVRLGNHRHRDTSREVALPAQDGWLVGESASTGTSLDEATYSFEAYSLDGTLVDSYEARTTDSTLPVIPLDRLASLAELRLSWTNPGSAALATSRKGNNGCVSEFSGSTFATFSADVLDTYCVDRVIPSRSSSVFLTRSKAQLDNGSVDTVASTATGQQVTFPGIEVDSVSEAIFSVSPELIIIKNYSGSVHAYAPAG